MPVFPQKYFTGDNTLVRTGRQGEREDYSSIPLGRKFSSTVKGVYTGFDPSALGSVLTLSPDPSEGLSNVKVQSRDDPAGLDVIVESPITLDYSGAVASDFLPDGLLVLARAHYLESGDTTAEIVSETKTTTVTAHTVGVTPETFDLSTITPTGTLIPGSISIAVNVDGSGPDTITDDSSGNLVSAGPALPGGGTIDYITGAMTGITASLTALSVVDVTRSRCPGQDEVLICRLTGTPASIVVNDSPPDDRDTPVALTGCTIPYGFLESGSIEALAAAVEILNEVQAARVDLQGVAHPDLKTRLDTDLGAPAMATRLGKVVRVLRSNTYSVAAGESEVIVSGSFTENDRNHDPLLTLNGDGDETAVGVIAAPNDDVRNVAVVLDATRRDRLLENQTTRSVVVGRIVQDADFLLDGTLTFTTALTVVTGNSSTQFTSQLEVGDAIQGADGLFYEVAEIDSDSQLILANAYQGATASSAGLLRRRIKLQFNTVESGVEVAKALETSVDIEFFFPAFVDVSIGNFDHSAAMHKPGERSRVPDATITVPGKVKNAQPGGFVGSILLEERGTPVAGGPFHTLNFTAANIVQNAPGELDVLTIGPTGPTGPSGSVGSPGPTGAPGPDIDQVADFERSGETPMGPGGPITATHTVNFGFDVDFLGGGIARLRDDFLFDPAEFVEIDDIRLDSAQVGTIEATGGSGGGGDYYVVLYLDAAGHNP